LSGNVRAKLAAAVAAGPAYAGNAEALRRFTQITADLAGRPLHELRVLDLACLEGQYGIELALHGAEVVGVDVRETHLAKARFAAELLGLRRYEVRRDDVRNLHPDSYGLFDVVLCIGILYHLDAPDVFDVIRRMASVCSRLLIVDTHVSDWGGRRLSHDGREYRGRKEFEHLPWSTPEERARKPWASIDNASSVWLSRASLQNALQDAGFTSVYECAIPAWPAPRADRATFAAVKGTPVTVHCTPGMPAKANRLPEKTMVRAAGVWIGSFLNRLRAKINPPWRRR
jgi:SAM-dependent methyltransferase